MEYIRKYCLWKFIFFLLAVAPCRLCLAEDDIFTVRDANGLEIQIRFRGYEEISPGGLLQYKKGDRLSYEASVKNKSNRSFPQLEMQTSLHVASSQCENLTAGSKLPGPTISPLHTASLTPGVSFNFNDAFTLSDSLCPLTAVLQLRLQYIQRGVIKAETIISPIPLSIE